VAIGTIADVAPLDGDNRALVRAGLEAVRLGARPGVRALLEHARVDTSLPLSAEDISHRIAPRINAPGRMGDPLVALTLLLAADLTEARAAAAACEQANLERREIPDRILAEAAGMLEKDSPESRAGIVLAQEGWHPGVVGIVAGRLATQLGKPVIVGASENGKVTASVRSAAGIPVVSALALCRRLVLGFGGHEKAAGVSFELSRLGELSEAFSAACKELAVRDSGELSRGAGVRLEHDDDPYAVLRDFCLLEPCGEANRAPTLWLVGAKVRSAREVKGGHLKLDLDVDGRTIGGFGARLGGVARQLGERVNVAGALRRDGYRGGTAVELRVDEVETA
jgi:single-stranded-DNA-specific exonuclease